MLFYRFNNTGLKKNTLIKFIVLIVLIGYFNEIQAQKDDLKGKLSEISAHFSECSQYLSDMLEQIRKAQNAAYIQDIDLYLDLALLHFEQFCTGISYTENLYLDVFELTKDTNWLDLKLYASKTYNRLIAIETETSRINNYLNDIDGTSEFAEIQQKLSMIRTSLNNIEIELPLCIKECKSQSLMISEHDK